MAHKATSILAAGAANLSTTPFVKYTDPGVEPSIENEQSLQDDLFSIIQKTQEHNFSMHRHAMRGTHVKTQAIVKGHITILSDLSEELAQGIASPFNAGTHDTAMRFANEPSFLQDDRTPGPRGCSMKIFDVKGASAQTQDLTFNNAPILELTDLPTTVEIFRIRERHFREPEKIMDDPEMKRRKDLSLQEAPGELPNHHFLGYVMYSQAAYRWGPYVAKYALFPTGEYQQKLSERRVDKESDPEQHSRWLREWFGGREATYDLRVQLCQDLKVQPVEDASVLWDETAFPFRTVARVVLPAGQDVFATERRVFWDERMKVNVWCGLEEHRPLGSVQRLRKELYARSSQFRAETNESKFEEVTCVDQIP